MWLTDPRLPQHHKSWLAHAWVLAPRGFGALSLSNGTVFGATVPRTQAGFKSTAATTRMLPTPGIISRQRTWDVKETNDTADLSKHRNGIFDPGVRVVGDQER